VSTASGQSLTYSTAPAKATGLTPRLALLQAQWGGLCERLFQELAAAAPNELAQLVREGNIKPTRLTYAAEILGRDVPDDAVAVPALLPLLKHPSHVVREGAILGLGFHLTGRVRAALQRAAQEDPSLAVRETAAETLEE
jgi:HEAT repeat protein